MFLPPWFVCVETLVILTTSRGLESAFNQPFRRFLGNSTNLAGETFSQTFSLWWLCEGSSRRVLIVGGFIYLNWGWHSSHLKALLLLSQKTWVYLPFYPHKHPPQICKPLVSHESSWKFFQVSDRIRARHPFWHVSYTKWPSIEILCFLEGWICLFGDGIVWEATKGRRECSEVQGGQTMWVMFFHILMYDSYTHNRHDMQNINRVDIHIYYINQYVSETTIHPNC